MSISQVIYKPLYSCTGCDACFHLEKYLFYRNNKPLLSKKMRTSPIILLISSLFITGYKLSLPADNEICDIVVQCAYGTYYRSLQNGYIIWR
ncbi:hypothetical protein HMPREF0619_01690 [Parabacteroides sp. D13]|nr:hypothetical protein HMPREF0619_01690 [Parabacteroides sp. D13]